MTAALLANKIVDVCADAGRRAVALAAIPKLARTPVSVPTGLTADEYVSFLRVLAGRFGPDGIEVALQIGAMLERITVHRGVLRDLLVDWSDLDLRAFAGLADVGQGFGPDAGRFVEWLFTHGMTQFPNLRRHVDAFGTPPNRAALEAFQAEFERVVRWDRSNYRLAAPEGPVLFDDAAEFGRALETRARAVMGGTGDLIDVDGLVTTRSGPEWNWGGANYSQARNFPFVDFVRSTGGRLEFGQIAHGNLGYLRGKFFKLTGQDVSVELVARSVEELQFLGWLPRAVTGRKQTTPELWGVFFDEFLPNARLWVPAPAVQPLRAEIAGRLSFQRLAQQWSREGGEIASRYLDVIQPLPASVYS
jgi:hypothetical protein